MCFHVNVISFNSYKVTLCSHPLSHLHLSNTVAAVLCYNTNGNEYDGDLEMKICTPSNKGTRELGKHQASTLILYVHSMGECVEAQTESNNTKDEECCLLKIKK